MTPSGYHVFGHAVQDFEGGATAAAVLGAIEENGKALPDGEQLLVHNLADTACMCMGYKTKILKYFEITNDIINYEFHKRTNT